MMSTLIRRGLSGCLAGFAVAIVFVAFAERLALPAPPNWLADLTGADGEFAYHLHPLCLVLDGIVVGLLIALCRPVLRRARWRLGS
jgi:hypothetical protein